MATNNSKKLNLVKREVTQAANKTNNPAVASATKPEAKSGSKKGLIFICAAACIVGGCLYFLSYRNSSYVEKIHDQAVEEALRSDEATSERNQQIARLEANGFICIAGGTFYMGRNDGGEDERPVHAEDVKSFYLHKYEVTQRQWHDIMGNYPSYFNGENHPVEMVSWFEAITFCNKLSQREGLQPCYTINYDDVEFHYDANGYRLPTETEWEYAARGGAIISNFAYSGSNNIGDVAWYNSNSYQTTHDVGTKSPNSLGLYDMSGNVYEWCANCYTPQLMTNADDMLNQLSENERVCRGGSFKFGAKYCRPTFRSNKKPNSKENRIGFRIARNSPI